MDVLCKGLNRPANSLVIPGVIPYNFCARCYSAVSNVVSGNTVKCDRSRDVISWEECNDSCFTCARLIEKKKPGQKKKKVSCTFSHLSGFTLNTKNFGQAFARNFKCLLLMPRS